MSNATESLREWNATSYHKVSNPHVSWGTKVLDGLGARGDETAFDLGCGTGRLTAELLERLPQGRVIAVDRSANMLAEAEAHLAPRFGDRVRFVQADLQTMTPEELGGPGDLVFSTATFHWIPDHDNLFRRIAALLVPGGRLVAQCGGGPNLARIKGRATVIQESEPYRAFFAGWTGPWNYADPAITAERLHNAGFAEIDTNLIEAPTTMPDADAFREFLTTVIFATHLSRIPDEALRHRYIDELTTQAAADAPPFQLDYWRLNMRAGRAPANG